MTTKRETEVVKASELKKNDALPNGIVVAEDARPVSKSKVVIAHTRPRVRGIKHLTMSKGWPVTIYKR